VENPPLNPQPPIGTPLGPTGLPQMQPIIGKMSTQGFQPGGQSGLNQQYLPQQQMSGNIQYPTGQNYQNFPNHVGPFPPSSMYNLVNPEGPVYQNNVSGVALPQPQAQNPPQGVLVRQLYPQQQVYLPVQPNWQQGGQPQ